MAEIFLSYRRDDSTSATGRLADALEARFGDERVFRDREIGAGENFVEAIRRSVESATVVLVIVGRRWLGVRDASGCRRLDDPGDFVRLEIELALAARVAVVPVLVEGAAMPSADDLPPSLAEFSRCQAVELADTRWRYDVDQLTEMLRARFAIDSDAAPLSSEGGSRSRALTRFASDMLDLAIHPRRLIARRQTGRASDYAGALAFLAAALVVGHVILLLGVGLPSGGGGSVAQTAAATAGLLLAGVFIGFVVVAVFASALGLAWLIAGRRPGFARVGLVFAYVYGGAWIGFCVGGAVLGAGVELVDPGFVGRAVEALRGSASSSAPVVMPQVEKTHGGLMQGPASLLILLGYALWVATVVWCVIAWGAFRQSFGATRAQALLTTSLWLALLVGVVWLGRHFG
jgi:hypothetical protein